jgi:lipopolysaccharide/colanic/teichoic acid biosynthesis glycosyltransferase
MVKGTVAMAWDGVGLTRRQAFVKRGFDVLASTLGLLVVSPIILLGWLVATIDTGQNGFFTQVRIGRDGLPFRIVKLRTMHDDPVLRSTVTTRSDPRITRTGRFLRTTKWNELPQLWNVFAGQMSFVGPRPEVPGFADRLEGEDTIVLSVRPGITGPATLRFSNEEITLDSVDDPDAYNIDTLFPEKVRLNREYVTSYGFLADIRYIFLTLGAITNLVFRRGTESDGSAHRVLRFEDHVTDPRGVADAEVAPIAESA